MGLVEYLVAAMMAWVPLHAHAGTADEAEARYRSIAEDVVSVAFDQNETPLVDEPGGRARTALLLLSVASYESGFREAVDNGERRGDHGASYCLMQIRVGDGTTSEGWSGADLIADRTRCFRSALHILRRSFNVCRYLPVDDRMSAYATGHCMRDSSVSRARVDRAVAWWTTHGT